MAPSLFLKEKYRTGSVVIPLSPTRPISCPLLTLALGETVGPFQVAILCYPAIIMFYNYHYSSVDIPLLPDKTRPAAAAITISPAFPEKAIPS